jgi:thymidylate kinase
MEKRPALNLVQKLCQALDAETVSYCHWKSNAMLDRSASGDNDLDILVSRADTHLFMRILYRLGFKEARVRSEKQMPGILDYYGYDRDTDKLVHVHAHYQLILGDDMTKNYRLPIENPFLESAIQADLFKIPAPEFEFIIFIIRMILKHSTWDAILSWNGTLPSGARRELKYLQTRLDHTRMYDILKEHLPFVDAMLFDECVRVLRPGCSIWTRIGVGQRLQRALQAHARRPYMSDTYLKLWRRVIVVIRQRVFRRSSRKRMAQGGAMIAVVGGDGAGKSTAIDGLYSWLSKNFDTLKVHMGKPPQSWGTLAVRGASLASRWLGALLNRDWSVQPGTIARSSVFLKYLWLLRRVCIAHDRYRAYVKARRFATNGGFVICDRYPLAQVKSMDGPLACQISNVEQANGLIEFLVRAESRYYQQIMPPELLIVLRVDPEVAVERRTDQEAAMVRERSQEICAVDWQQTRAHVIDACRSKADVLAELKPLIWSGL